MALAKNLMGLGFSALQASGDFIAAVATAISAAGTTQATATALTADCHLVSTAAANSGVIVYNGVIGDSQVVFNDNTGNTFFVYPPVGSRVNNLSTNSGVLLAPNTAAIFVKVTSTRWLAILSA